MHSSARSAVRLTLRTLPIACLAGSAFAAEIRVRVVDQAGAAVPDVAIYAEPIDVGASSTPQATLGRSAVMDQVGSQFVPHILVIQTGTEVLFPNSDVVSHHVYSFSETKTFELDLYRGNIHPPQLFDRSGLVVVGCNIHDGMLGFILVVDTPYFGKTGDDGTLVLPEMPQGSYRVAAWTPRASVRDLPLPLDASAAASGRQDLTFHLTSKLKPAHTNGHGSLKWKHY